VFDVDDYLYFFSLSHPPLNSMLTPYKKNQTSPCSLFPLNIWFFFFFVVFLILSFIMELFNISGWLRSSSFKLFFIVFFSYLFIVVVYFSYIIEITRWTNDSGLNFSFLSICFMLKKNLFDPQQTTNLVILLKSMYVHFH